MSTNTEVATQEEPAVVNDDPELIRIMSKIVEAMRFDAIPAIAVLAGRKKNEGAAFTLRHLRSLVDEYDATLADANDPRRPATRD